MRKKPRKSQKQPRHHLTAKPTPVWVVQPNAFPTNTSSKESISCYIPLIKCLHWSLTADEMQTPLPLFCVLVSLTFPFLSVSCSQHEHFCSDQDGLFTLAPARKPSSPPVNSCLLVVPHMMTSPSICPTPDSQGQDQSPCLLFQVSCDNQHTAGHVMGGNNRISDRNRNQVGLLQSPYLIGQPRPKR